MIAEKYTTLASPIHRLSPRVKLVSALLALTCILLAVPLLDTRFQLRTYMTLLGLSFALAVMSKVPLRFFLVRIALVIPFSGFVILVNILSGTVRGLDLILLITRAMLAVFIIILLISTTPFHQILDRLKKWHTPQLIILLLTFVYRYISTLRQEMAALERGLGMRQPGLSGWARTKVYANIVGMLFIRSYDRAERIHRAMMMRGFSGEMR